MVINLLAVFYCGLLPGDQLFPAELLMQLEASSFPPKITLLISSPAMMHFQPVSFNLVSGLLGELSRNTSVPALPRDPGSSCLGLGVIFILKLPEL